MQQRLVKMKKVYLLILLPWDLKGVYGELLLSQ